MNDKQGVDEQINEILRIRFCDMCRRYNDCNIAVSQCYEAQEFKIKLDAIYKIKYEQEIRAQVVDEIRKQVDNEWDRYRYIDIKKILNEIARQAKGDGK